MMCHLARKVPARYYVLALVTVVAFKMTIQARGVGRLNGTSSVQLRSTVSDSSGGLTVAQMEAMTAAEDAAAGTSVGAGDGHDTVATSVASFDLGKPKTEKQLQQILKELQEQQKQQALFQQQLEKQLKDMEQQLKQQPHGASTGGDESLRTELQEQLTQQQLSQQQLELQMKQQLEQYQLMIREQSNVATNSDVKIDAPSYTNQQRGVGINVDSADLQALAKPTTGGGWSDPQEDFSSPAPPAAVKNNSVRAETSTSAAEEGLTPFENEMVKVIREQKQLVAQLRDSAPKEEEDVGDSAVVALEEWNNQIPSSDTAAADSAPLPPEPHPSNIIAYQLPVLYCFDDPALPDRGKELFAGTSELAFRDIAAVIQLSVHRNSAENPASGSRFHYQMYAAVHPKATVCTDRATGKVIDRVSVLEDLGYKVKICHEPVYIKEVRGLEFLQYARNDGYYGIRDYIRLNAFNLVEHPVVVVLDLTTLILQPMDQLFAPLIGVETSMKAFYAKDYSAVTVQTLQTGIDFLIAKPSVSVYDELIGRLREERFQGEKGWGGLGFGGFNGAMTTGGLLRFFYEHMHSGAADELDSCIVNHNEDPYIAVDGVLKCRNVNTCQDCRSSAMDDIKVASFTVCNAPWSCEEHDSRRNENRLCFLYGLTWFDHRKELEEQWPGFRVADRSGPYKRDQFYGFCNEKGYEGYVPMV